MDNEEYVSAQKVIAESTSTLAVQALREANEELQGEVTFLKEEISRLRRAVKATRTTNRSVRRQATELVTQIEEMGTHIFDMAAQETETDEQGFVDPRLLPGGVCASDEPYTYDAEERAARDKQKADEDFTRGWVEQTYQKMRVSGQYPMAFPLSPAEVYAAAQTGITAALDARISDEPQTT